MPLPGTFEESEIKPLLKKLLGNKDEVYKFALAASGPKDGQLILDKLTKLKKQDVQKAVEAEAQKSGKGGKFDVMTGECRQDAKSPTVLRLIVSGKAPAKAVACMEHLLLKGPYKAVGFTGVILEEVDESKPESPAVPTAGQDAVAESGANEQAEWQKAVAKIESEYLQAVRNDRNDGSKLRAVMTFAQGKAEAGDYKTAVAALKKLAELLAASTSAGGSETKSEPAGDDLHAEYKTKLSQWGDVIKTAILAKGPNADATRKLLAQANSLSKPGGDIALALDKLNECHILASAPATTPPEAAVARWNAARSVVTAKLREEIKEVASSDHPDAAQAELELRSVMMQLAGKLEDRKQVAEIERWLGQDDVVADICEMAFDLRNPLLEVLADIRSMFPE